MTQHASLTPERWARFTLAQQILMIGNEMNRTSRLLADEDPDSRRRGYERVLRLTDLTVEMQIRPALRRELLRWRELAARLYSEDAADADAHRAAFRALLQLHPVAAQQIPLVLD
jgi:hypothetical protein